MSKIDDSVRFYRKMSDLQEKLRRSEEERLELEEKFTLLMRACRDEEEIRLSMLREKYEKFLEEEKIRKERNERILLTLERIESRANMLTAKSERLRLLRRHYEAYLMRMYPKWKYTSDKSKAATDQDLLTNTAYGLDGKLSPASFHPIVERELRSCTPLPQYNHYGNITVPTSYQFPPSEERTISSVPAARPFSTSPSIPPLSTPIDSTAKFDKEAKVSDSASLGQIPIIRTQGPVLPEGTSVEGPVISRVSSQIPSCAERTTELLSIKPEHKHQLNKYLNDAQAVNMKQTDQQHRDYVNSEQEQNTSGDLLNVSLSDDGILHEEVEHTKNENMVSQTGDIQKNRKELAGGDAFQINPKTSQQMAAIPPSNQLGAGDFGQQIMTEPPQNQNTELQKRMHQMQDKTQIPKQYIQENLQQYVGEQQLQTYESVHQPQITELQQQSKDELNQSAEDQFVMQEQIQPVPEEHVIEQNTETELKQSINYNDEYQKQFDQQPTEPHFNDQYEQQLAGMQEGQYGQPYDQEYATQFDQQYSEDNQLAEQYNLQYPEQSQMDQQFNLQYSEQDQVNQQYYEQYPQESETAQQYAEQNEIDQQYQLNEQYDQQYLEQAPDDQLYQQQYDDQGQLIQDSYGESQQGYPEEVAADQAYGEQQNDVIQYAENQQYSVTAPFGGGEQFEQNLGAQELTSVEQNLPQVEHIEEHNEKVQQQNSIEHLHQEKQLHEAEGLHQQQFSSLVVPQHGPEKQNQDYIYESQQKDAKEAETASEQKNKQLDEHHDATTDKQPEADIEEYRRLLGETGEVETSETDELEAQLAELVEPNVDGAKQVQKTIQPTTDKPVSRGGNPVPQIGNVDDTSSSDTGDNIPPLLQETSATKLTVETLKAPEKQLQPKEDTVTPVLKARPASKRLPVLNKVLESDSESLQLDATVSNAESDDFDFSSEQ